MEILFKVSAVHLEGEKTKKTGVPCPMVRKLPRDAQLDVPDMHRACKPEPGVCDNAEQKECLVIR